jgi:hypothetical protein
VGSGKVRWRDGSRTRDDKAISSRSGKKTKKQG